MQDKQAIIPCCRSVIHNARLQLIINFGWQLSNIHYYISYRKRSTWENQHAAKWHIMASHTAPQHKHCLSCDIANSTNDQIWKSKLESVYTQSKRYIKKLMHAGISPRYPLSSTSTFPSKLKPNPLRVVNSVTCDTICSAVTTWSLTVNHACKPMSENITCCTIVLMIEVPLEPWYMKTFPQSSNGAPTAMSACMKQFMSRACMCMPYPYHHSHHCSSLLCQLMNDQSDQMEYFLQWLHF